MTKHNAENERIKRAYRLHLRAARGLSEATIDVATAAIHRFEQSTGFRSFKKFHFEQAIAFRRRLDEAISAHNAKPFSKATVLQILNSLRAFFLWLAEQPGYRSRVRYSDAEYFRLSEKDTRVAKAPKPRPVPTPEQIESVLQRSPCSTVLERRNRAMIAFTWLTGVRDGALISLRLKHVDLADQLVDQDPREVRTKNSKPQRTIFFGVGGSAQQIVTDWVSELLRDHLWGHDDPLFPATLIEQGPDRQFTAVGIGRSHWASADAARKIFKQSFEAIRLHGFNPHSFRHALAALGEKNCRTAEEFKAWSQNLGHEGVLTTLSSYGAVAEQRQAEIIRGLASRAAHRAGADTLAERVAEAVRRELNALPG
jgi:integrase/recombinase XerD